MQRNKPKFIHAKFNLSHYVQHGGLKREMFKTQMHRFIWLFGFFEAVFFNLVRPKANT